MTCLTSPVPFLLCGLGKTIELFPVAAPTAKAYPLEAHNAAVEVWQAKIPKPAAERSSLNPELHTL